MPEDAVEVDVLVVGGGVAGLRTYHALRRAGYSAILRTRGPLGEGQTVASQGIIHGGIKYALRGEASAASRAIARMPEVWAACFRGEGDVDLRGVRILSDHQYLWTTGGLASKLMGVAASKAIRTPVERVDFQDRPLAFAGADKHVDVYSVDETVIDPRSLIEELARGARVVDETVLVRAHSTVWCAGSGNPPQVMQIRPLHMVMVRSGSGGSQLPLLYGHCITGGLTDKPRVTITSQRDSLGRVVWYVGGMLSESGVSCTRDELIERARKELSACVAWVSLKDTQWATLRVDRAEGNSPSGRRPDGPMVQWVGEELVVWPTKLAFAPLAAAMVVEKVRTKIMPSVNAPPVNLSTTPGVTIAVLPWEREDVEWS